MTSKHAAIALAALAAVSAPTFAESIDVSLFGSSSFSSNPQKQPVDDSGQETSVGVSLAIQENFGRNRLSADYQASVTSSSGAATNDQTRLTGTLRAELPLNERVELSLAHTAEELTTDVTAPNTVDNQTSTQTFTAGLNVTPLNPGRGALQIQPEFTQDVVTDGSGEDVTTLGVTVTYDYALDPVTLVSPFVRLTDTDPEVSEDIEYRAVGVRANRSLRQLNYFGEVAFAASDTATGSTDEEVEYRLGLDLDRGFYSVGAALGRSIDTDRDSSVVEAQAVGASVRLTSAQRSTTDTATVNFEYLNLCDRCLVNGSYSLTDQQFSEAAANDRATDAYRLSGSYLLTRRSTLGLGWQYEETEFDSTPVNNFDLENWSGFWDYRPSPTLTVRTLLKQESRSNGSGLDDYDEWGATISVSKQL